MRLPRLRQETPQKRLETAKKREEGALIISITTKTIIATSPRFGNRKFGPPHLPTPSVAGHSAANGASYPIYPEKRKPREIVLPHGFACSADTATQPNLLTNSSRKVTGQPPCISWRRHMRKKGCMSCDPPSPPGTRSS